MCKGDAILMLLVIAPQLGFSSSAWYQHCILLILISTAQRGGHTLNALFKLFPPPKLQAMSAADVVFRLGYMMVLSAKLFHWDRMIFPVR